MSPGRYLRGFLWRFEGRFLSKNPARPFNGPYRDESFAFAAFSVSGTPAALTVYMITAQTYIR